MSLVYNVVWHHYGLHIGYLLISLPCYCYIRATTPLLLILSRPLTRPPARFLNYFCICRLIRGVRGVVRLKDVVVRQWDEELMGVLPFYRVYNYCVWHQWSWCYRSRWLWCFIMICILWCMFACVWCNAAWGIINRHICNYIPKPLWFQIECSYETKYSTHTNAHT